MLPTTVGIDGICLSVASWSITACQHGARSHLRLKIPLGTVHVFMFIPWLLRCSVMWTEHPVSKNTDRTLMSQCFPREGCFNYFYDQGGGQGRACRLHEWKGIQLLTIQCAQLLKSWGITRYMCRHFYLSIFSGFHLVLASLHILVPNSHCLRQHTSYCVIFVDVMSIWEGG